MKISVENYKEFVSKRLSKQNNPHQMTLDKLLRVRDKNDYYDISRSFAALMYKTYKTADWKRVITYKIWSSLQCPYGQVDPHVINYINALDDKEHLFFEDEKKFMIENSIDFSPYLKVTGIQQ